MEVCYVCCCMCLKGKCKQMTDRQEARRRASPFTELSQGKQVHLIIHNTDINFSTFKPPFGASITAITRTNNQHTSHIRKEEKNTATMVLEATMIVYAAPSLPHTSPHPTH